MVVIESPRHARIPYPISKNNANHGVAAVAATNMSPHLNLERIVGFEPTLQLWKSFVLPLTPNPL